MPALINWKGQIFNNCEILTPVDPWNVRSEHLWKVKCYCGNIFETTPHSLKRELTKSCGCLHLQRTKEMGLSNKKYNYYNYVNPTTLIKLVRPVDPLKDKWTNEWVALCPHHEQPQEFITFPLRVIGNGNTTSCGCLMVLSAQTNIRKHHIVRRLNKGLNENELIISKSLELRNQLFDPIKHFILQTDGHTCCSCLKDNVTLYVHHIDPIGFDFDFLIKENYFKIYDLNNLITLCRDCHDEAHNYNPFDLNYDLQENFMFIVKQRFISKEIILKYNIVKEQIEFWLDGYISKLGVINEK